MKKIVVLILALVMLASILVMPAMAAEAEARHPLMICPKCGGTTRVIKFDRDFLTYKCDFCGNVFSTPNPAS